MKYWYQLLILTILLTSCAIVSSPEGGPKDVTPPEIIKTTPDNFSKNFAAKEIVIEFDEYVALKGFGSQFYTSPPLTERVDQRLKGKKLYITLHENLRPNTTYTFNFGTALTDITEGNVQSTFKYVFSTGPNLDSLKIKGRAIDAYTGQPDAGALAMLYPANVHDTTLLKTKPLYYTITDEQGNFSIENLALDTFQLFVVHDENINLIYDHGVEKYGFHGAPISSIDSEPHIIRTFKGNAAPALLEANHKAFGRIDLSFSAPPKNLTVKLVGDNLFPDDIAQTLVPDENGDTVQYWFNAKEFAEEVPFVFLNIKADSLESDSVRVLLKKHQPAPVSVKWQKTKNVSPRGVLHWTSDVPFEIADSTLISLHKDSISKPFVLAQNNPKTVAVNFERKYGESLRATFLPGALKDLMGNTNDTINLGLNVATEDNLAILILKLEAASKDSKIAQLYDLDTKEIIFEQPFSDSLSATLPDLAPTKYGLRIVWDENQNGQYDVGEFNTRQQPEVVAYYPRAIELRANWELETVWQIPER